MGGGLLSPVSGMKKLFGFGSRKGQSPSRASASPRRDSGLPPSGRGPGYLLRDKDLGKLHRAAAAGEAAKVQQLLLLKKHDPNGRDKENRSKETKIQKTYISYISDNCRLVCCTEAIKVFIHHSSVHPPHAEYIRMDS